MKLGYPDWGSAKMLTMALREEQMEIGRWTSAASIISAVFAVLRDNKDYLDKIDKGQTWWKQLETNDQP